MTVRCTKCGRAFDWQGPERRAGMACEALGEEYFETWFFCEPCGVYTLEIHHDTFLGEEVSRTAGPIEKDRGDRAVALIRQCSTPWDKTCDCAAHAAYFGPEGW